VVIKCRKSGVRLISRTDRIDITYYQNTNAFLSWDGDGKDQNKYDFDHWKTQTRNDAVLITWRDTERRSEGTEASSEGK
jgi:hypothetical protein